MRRDSSVLKNRVDGEAAAMAVAADPQAVPDVIRDSPITDRAGKANAVRDCAGALANGLMIPTDDLDALLEPRDRADDNARGCQSAIVRG